MRTTTLILGAALCALPATPIKAEPVRSLLEQREALVITQQWDLSCGAAALATLLTYQHGIEVSERQVAARLIDRPDYLANPYIIRARHGFSLLDMKRVADQYGLDSEGFGQLAFGDLDPLAPLVVRIDPHGYPHFVIYRGSRGDTVYIADPAFGLRSMPRARFERAWTPDARYGRVGFRIARRDRQRTPDRLALASGGAK